MKKLLLVIAALVLMVGGVSASPSRVAVADLTALAQYFPENSVAFGSIRTDDEFVATLDSLVEQVVGQVMPGAQGISLTQSLDALATNVKRGATFESLFGVWLGDTAAAGILPLTNMDARGNPIALIAISITDREAAEAFFLSNTDADDYEQTAGDDFTAYENVRGNTHVVFRDDVVLIASDFAAIAEGGAPDSALSADSDFTDALDLLPESDYNGALYVDLPAIYDLALSMTPRLGAAENMVMDMVEGIKPLAFGLTILDDTSLTIDMVTSSDVAGMGALSGMFTPLDLSVVERIPAGTPLVALGTNLSDNFNYSWSLLEELTAMPGMDEDSAEQIALGLWAVEFGVRGFTGMNLQDEILPAFNGTYALYAGINPTAENVTSATDVSPDELLDFALLLQATDPDAAARLSGNLVNTLRDLPELPQDNLRVSIEEINGTEAVRVGVETYPRNGHEFEVLLAVTEDVFVVGSRRYVEAALDPDVGLDQDPQWQEALQYTAQNPYSLLYQSSDNLATLGDLFSTTPGRNFSEMGMALSVLTTVVNSSSISYGRLDDGGVWMRAVLTLNGA